LQTSRAWTATAQPIRPMASGFNASNAAPIAAKRTLTAEI
jgi:hypothetical protein